MLIRRRDEEVAAVELCAPDPVDTVVAVGVGDVHVLGVDLQAVDILASDVVDHAGHGIRAVDRRAAGLEHFDVADRRIRNGGDVVEAAYGRRELLGEASVVEDHGRKARAEIAQIHRGRVDRVAGLPVQLTDGLSDFGEVLDHVDGGRAPHVLEVFVVEYLHRNRRIFRQRRDERSRDHDLLDRKAAVGFLRAGLRTQQRQ